METQENSRLEKIKAYLCDLILGRVFPLIALVISGTLCWGLGCTLNFAYPKAEQQAEIDASQIPGWWQIGARIYVWGFFGIVAVIMIRQFIDRRTVLCKANGDVIFYYLLVNLIFIFILKYLNN